MPEVSWLCSRRVIPSATRAGRDGVKFPAIVDASSGLSFAVPANPAGPMRISRARRVSQRIPSSKSISRAGEADVSLGNLEAIRLRRSMLRMCWRICGTIASGVSQMPKVPPCPSIVWQRRALSTSRFCKLSKGKSADAWRRAVSWSSKDGNGNLSDAFIPTRSVQAKNPRADRARNARQRQSPEPIFCVQSSFGSGRIFSGPRDCF